MIQVYSPAGWIRPANNDAAFYDFTSCFGFATVAILRMIAGEIVFAGRNYYRIA